MKRQIFQFHRGGATCDAWATWKAATERAAVICDEVRHPHGGYCETVDWVNGTFYCATIIRKGNE